VVVDGFWGRGLRDLPCPVVSVAHGTWRDIARATGSTAAARLGDIQAEEYARLPVVAVSEKVRRDLWDLYGVQAAAVILNGVDTIIFHPGRKRPRSGGPLVLYPSDAWVKGGDVVNHLRARMPGWTFETIGGKIGEEPDRIAQADVFLAPSRTEGNSYAALQAMASGVPVVASRTGLFGELYSGMLAPFSRPGLFPERVGTEPETLEEWALYLQQVYERRVEYGKEARDWVVRYASLPVWAQQWEDFLWQLRQAI
jgi:hypothetical protein